MSGIDNIKELEKGVTCTDASRGGDALVIVQQILTCKDGGRN